MSPAPVALPAASAPSHAVLWDEVSPGTPRGSEPKPGTAAPSAPPARHQSTPKAAAGPGYLLSVGLFEFLPGDPAVRAAPGWSRVREQVINPPCSALFCRYFEITATSVSRLLSPRAGSVRSTGDCSHLALFMYITLGLSEAPRRGR